MKRHVLPSLAALVVCAFGIAARAAPGESPEPIGIERMQHWATDHEALLNARLAGLKAGLKLTTEQEKLWSPFETAVRDAAKMHMEQMKARMERMHEMRDIMEQSQDAPETKDIGPTGQTRSPVDRLERMAHRMTERAAALTKVAEAAKPLYASFDDSQKRLFGFLGRELLMMGHGHRGMGMMGGGREMRGEGGMGMMGREPDRMNMMGGQSNGDEDSSNEE
jgi:hypothetical protein